MKKNEFVELVQTTGGYKTKAEAEATIKAFTGAVETVLSKNDEISLVGFGSFSTGFQAGKSGKVPGTDKTYTTEDKMVPKFKYGKSVKDSVAGNPVVK